MCGGGGGGGWGLEDFQKLFVTSSNSFTALICLSVINPLSC